MAVVETLAVLMQRRIKFHRQTLEFRMARCGVLGRFDRSPCIGGRGGVEKVMQGTSGVNFELGVSEHVRWPVSCRESE